MVETFRTLRLLRSLRRTTRASPERLAELQVRLLRDALSHAARHVPFYRRTWAGAGADAPLAALPVISQAAGRAALESGELVAEGVDRARCPVFHSTGSSGRPLEVPRGPVEQRLWRAVALRSWLELGYRWRDTTAHLDLEAGPAHPFARLGVSRTEWLSPRPPVEQQLRALTMARAAFVVSTPTVLRRLAFAAEATGARPSPRVVVSQGELLDGSTRGLIERVLGTPPVEVYGLTEVGYVAWQCERREGLHVNADTVLVEVLRDGEPVGPGELGSLVVTDLRGRTAPLIRYDTGDLAVVATAPCPCGRSLPTLASIEGRGRDAIRMSDGRLVTPRALVEHLSDVLAPDRYRVEADGAGRVRLHVADGVDAEPVARRLRELLGTSPAVEPGLSPGPGEPMKSQPVVALQTLPARSS